MNTMKSLMLAGFAALSLGVGSAMAQESPSMPTVDYWTAKGIAAQSTAIPGANQIQSGSSDVGAAGFGPAVHFDYGTLANPG
jgi:hypothetical protein